MSRSTTGSRTEQKAQRATHIKGNGSTTTDNAHNFAIVNIDNSLSVGSCLRFGLTSSHNDVSGYATDDQTIKGIKTFIIELDVHSRSVLDFGIDLGTIGSDTSVTGNKASDIGFPANIQSRTLNGSEKLRPGSFFRTRSFTVK
ncbi:hypothetical protein [Sutterella sp. KLE1602]|uniref:hypothetical protein n=1 Tax=Sutterella sp. KLE1602 TaxID=1574262 RepID=UPI000782CD67|nr:hypothetical protein [Sutterella sp. KLE1602]